jgi:dTDP-4-dehydrorhamnose 3,5-epimerase
LKTRELGLSGLLVLELDLFRDARGHFYESYSEPRYRELGIDCRFVQDNVSRSMRDVLRGLHYQSAPGQAKLVSVLQGRVFDVAVDLRPQSPTYGRWRGHYLDAAEFQQLFVPQGFAHGFCVVSDSAVVQYKVSAPYDAATECTLTWNDPELGISWPVSTPLLSARDQRGESFADFTRRARP